MKRLWLYIAIMSVGTTAWAQRVLTLDDCRQLALDNNKQLTIARVKQDAAANDKRAMRTKYLPKVDALAGYEWTSREISLLSDETKDKLNNLGTNLNDKMSSTLTNVIGTMVQNGVITPQAAQAMGSTLGKAGQAIEGVGNQLGQGVTDAFRSDTRNMFAGSIFIRQPLYMGGAITAANRIADLKEQLMTHQIDMSTQSILYDIEQTYWLVVSVQQKNRLAHSFYDLVKKLNDDVHKMIDEGVATRADGLKVDVRVNEAEMAITQAEDGVALAKMLLCQLCGLPMDSDITLADENSDDIISSGDAYTADGTADGIDRPELHLLEGAIDISREATKLVRAAYLPQVALNAGYLISNPSVYNGFENKFKGIFNVGVIARIPVWTWHEGRYKMNAAKAATTIAELEYEELSEKIDLQVSQCRFKVKEAHKKCDMARKNISSAEENLRCATVGFQEGVMSTTDVMAAQTAWQQAKSQLIEAESDLKMAQVALRKAVGDLRGER